MHFIPAQRQECAKLPLNFYRNVLPLFAHCGGTGMLASISALIFGYLARAIGENKTGGSIVAQSVMKL